MPETAAASASAADQTPDDPGLLRRARAGDAGAWGSLLMKHEPRLMRMVAFRLDARLHGRVDAADVVQEAFAAAAEHRDDFFRVADLPLFLWLRGVVGNKLLEIHRHHLGTKRRDAGRDIPLYRPSPDETSASLAVHLSAHVTRPSVAAARDEACATLRKALDGMEETDREVLAMRHFEQLTNAEAAQVLGIQERAAAKRYLRALKRLKDILAEMPGGLTGLRP
jgi:RNA polymerase sigma-70 factor (ECF subfamily)